ncbi:hypothetical protein [Mucilaginibacter sp.]
MKILNNIPEEIIPAVAIFAYWVNMDGRLKQMADVCDQIKAALMLNKIKDVYAICRQKCSRAETILREKSAELENMLDSITDGFYALNRNWEVTFINRPNARCPVPRK